MNSEKLPPALPASLPADRVVGITTTVPVEIIYAAGMTPVDLNNLFITCEDPPALVSEAERAGFPQTCCCWIKGIYAAAHRFQIGTVVGVTRGDCSSTHALLEVLQHEGRRSIPFEYPAEPDEAAMQASLEDFASVLGTGLDEADQWRRRLDEPRRLAAEIDRLGWQEGRVSGRESHLWLVAASDFCGDPAAYAEAARNFIEEAAARQPATQEVRLGYGGVPPIVDGLYDYVESCGALVVLNETQRQFAMLGPADSLAQLYTRYTYPYGIFPRVSDIAEACEVRSLDGVLHYVQSFCYRRIQAKVLREALPVPVLTLECDRPGTLSGQLKTRIEAFVQMLELHKRKGAPS